MRVHEANVAEPKMRACIRSGSAYLLRGCSDASVAQPGRASPCQGECRGFESLRSLQSPLTTPVTTRHKSRHLHKFRAIPTLSHLRQAVMQFVPPRLNFVCVVPPQVNASGRGRKAEMRGTSLWLPLGRHAAMAAVVVTTASTVICCNVAFRS